MVLINCVFAARAHMLADQGTIRILHGSDLLSLSRAVSGSTRVLPMLADQGTIRILHGSDLLSLRLHKGAPEGCVHLSSSLRASVPMMLQSTLQRT